MSTTMSKLCVGLCFVAAALSGVSASNSGSCFPHQTHCSEPDNGDKVGTCQQAVCNDSLYCVVEPARDGEWCGPAEDGHVDACTKSVCTGGRCLLVPNPASAGNACGPPSDGSSVSACEKSVCNTEGKCVVVANRQAKGNECGPLSDGSELGSCQIGKCNRHGECKARGNPDRTGDACHFESTNPCFVGECRPNGKCGKVKVPCCTKKDLRTDPACH